MTITVEIPDEFASRMVPEGQEPARKALEDMAVEAYRAHRLTAAQLRRLLGISSRYELDGFLKERGVWLEYTVEDFQREGEITDPLLARRRQEIGARRDKDCDERK
jgi:predicted HTH domain antitoxin